jgi:putative ABC transport system substrate-binding protein
MALVTAFRRRTRGITQPVDIDSEPHSNETGARVVLYAIKRLGLGLGLIALAAAILLITDLEQRAGSASPVLRVALLQHANTVVLDDGIRGTLEALAERGFRDGDRLTIDRFNAQGDMPTGIAIARQVTAGSYDLVITSSTPSLQAVANNNRDGKVRHVFTLVADPYVAGIGLERANPLKHPPYLVGQGVFPPVERAFQIARQMLPTLARVGTVWNPAEANSLAFVTRARDVAKQMNLTLLEANADNTPAVGEALRSLFSRSAQAIWVGGDNTVIAAIGSVIAACQRRGIPVFTILPGAPDRGSLFDVGPDFYQVGYEGGVLAAAVLSGEDMSRIAIRDVQDVVPAYLSVNTTVLKDVKDRWRIPDEVLAAANVVVDQNGVRKQEPVRGSSWSSQDARPPTK